MNKLTRMIGLGICVFLLSKFADAADPDSSIKKANPKKQTSNSKPTTKHKANKNKKTTKVVKKDSPQPPIRKAFEPEMLAITGGCFQMGSPASEPQRFPNEKQHKVCVENFEIGKYEVTQAQWKAVMGKNPSKFNGDNLPVEQISWNDAQSFIAKLNTETGKTYRLPTETEWEYAARAGTTTPFYTGNCINAEQANFNGNYDYNDCGKGIYKQQTTPVGSYSPNAWGLYDMAGNVWEWTSDCYENNNCSKRIMRGGSWGSFAKGARSAYRYGDKIDSKNDNLGFRIALTLQSK
jgi:formylglycine-generating enzyme required for sulfatase activity